MSDYDGSITFKDWLPDLPDLNNPGLTEARNTLYVDGSYIGYPTSVTTGTATSSKVIESYRAMGFLNVPAGVIYAGLMTTTNSRVVAGVPASGLTQWDDWTPSALSFNSQNSVIDFIQYSNLVIALDGSHTPIYQTFGAASTMLSLSTTMGAAPIAQCGGVVAQFVVLDVTNATSPAVQWSGIDAPLNWPAPNSDTAVAQQSGRQYLDASMNKVKGITQGDQWGLVMQDGGITRMTYANSAVVFDFSVIHRGPGPIGFNAWVQRGSLTYYASAAGFFMCDGVQSAPIGNGKVDRYFLSRVDGSNLNRVYAEIDYTRRLIYWTLPKATDATRGDAEEMLVYNYQDNRWSHVFNTVRLFIRGGEGLSAQVPIAAFSHTNKYVEFSGAPGTAIFTTAETEPNPGGFSRMQGVKPLVDVTANAVTVALGTRNDRSSAVTYTSEITANARSGMANFRSEARYHRARLTIVGTFNAAQGLEYQAAPSGFT